VKSSYKKEKKEIDTTSKFEKINDKKVSILH